MARNMTDCFNGFLKGKKYCIMDRDPIFTTEFRNIFKGAGVHPLRLPAKSPDLNAYIERFIGTMRKEISKDFIPRPEEHLRYVLEEHLAYYNRERNHQGRENNKIPIPFEHLNTNKGAIIKRSRLGNRLNFYYREAV